MCRHAAYVGEPVRLADVLLDAPHALAHQVWSPRLQEPGATNADGWGVAWWDGDGGLHRYRSTVPLTDDGAGQELLRTTVARAFVAAVRRASPGLALAETGNAPFVSGPWAFSLNGYVGGWAAGAAADALRAQLSPARRASLEGDTDSEVLFGLVLDRLDEGDVPDEALAKVTSAALAVETRPSKLNLLLGDGRRIWATRHGNSLFTRPGAAASEPWDADALWREAPDGAG